MAKFKRQSTNSLTHLFIYVLTLLLLWEWLRPIPVVTDTGHIHLFVWFAFFSAVLIYLRVPLWGTIPSTLVASLYGLHRIYYEGRFLSFEGGWQTFIFFVDEFTYNSSLIFSGEFANLTDPFRTFLLFLLLALICYLLYFWIFQTKSIFMFLLSTVIYITVLDTFTAIDASMAIIRIVVIGFFMLTLLHMLKVKEDEQAIGKRASTFFSPTWLYTLIIMIAIATFVGVVAPKPEAKWSDPVPTIRSFVLGEGSGTGSQVRRVGYGENDEQLGGGFRQDDDVVFTAEVEESTYWRGESKHEYTGKGWVSDPSFVESTYIFEDEIDYYMFDELAELVERQVSIEMEDGIGFSHFFYPGQLKQVNLDTLSFLADGDDGEINQLTFNTDTVGGRIEASSDEFDPTLKSYELTYDDPTFPIETLRNIDEENDSEDIKDLYLQLPDDLPSRVIDLAEEIVEDEENRYDKAKAVEQYFSENDFQYQTTDIPVPEEGEDYVDQFLFETQIGYCDNYSTSMAVMLRALDIPTRWVKGFTAGELIGEADDGRSEYEVSNGNAHSWVEVYFPGAGWVPFEPTQGFENYADFQEEDSEIDEESENEDDNNSAEEALDDDMSPDSDNGLDEGVDAESSARADGSGKLTEYFTLKVFFISIVVMYMVIVFYLNQSKFQKYYFLWHYRMIGQDSRYTKAYHRLLWMLKNDGLPRDDGETLREYGKRIDMVLNSKAMGNLTKTYEKIYYGGYQPEKVWEEHQKDWEEIVKLLSS
ncbi:DUF3488 and DUF4129 domain-containing transglutaminase family protein [Salipaludibacillus sp. HK11]|uniref:transglutaminase TgpA family protein n=1 Tax=Salipaludibacillus sp. HK11 TaxID=3394320 RepID=UPI0039FBCFB3